MMPAWMLCSAHLSDKAISEAARSTVPAENSVSNLGYNPGKMTKCKGKGKTKNN